MVDALTAHDRKLYRMAKDRFVREIGEVERKHGKKILCANTLAKIGVAAESPEIPDTAEDTAQVHRRSRAPKFEKAPEGFCHRADEFPSTATSP